MTSRRIVELIDILPEESPYLSHHGSRWINKSIGTSRTGEVEKLAICKNDPAFGWNFARSFAELGVFMPAFAFEDALRRAYVWNSKYEQEHDPDITQCLAFQHPENISYYRAIRTMLLDPRRSFQYIANYVDTSPDVVRLYEQLFFNVRDRMHEKCYISHIAWPQTRQVEYQFAYNQREDAGYLMMRTAVNHGSAVALGFAGHSTAVTEIDSSISTGRMESMVMSSGLDDARMGFSSQGGDVPNIRRAQDIIKANKAGGNDDRNSDEVMGLGAISAGKSVMDTLLKMQEPEILNRRRLQKVLLAQSESDKKQMVKKGE